MNEYDVIILGGGPGGYVSAIRCRQLGLTTALVEKESLGGTCLNWGCVPTKALLRNAEVIQLMRQGSTFGCTVPENSLSIDYSAAQKRSREVSGRLVKGISSIMKKNGVQVFSEEGFVRDSRTVELKQSGIILKGNNIILATGARAASLPGIEPDGKAILFPKDALSITEIPKTIAIIGAGAIGIEFASIWNDYGADIHMFELMERVLPKEDRQVSDEVARQFDKRGITVRTGTRVTEIRKSGPGLSLCYQTGFGETKALGVDMVLMAPGIVPNSSGNGIDTLLTRNERAYVPVNEYMETEIPGVFAIGDLTGLFPLAHVASAQGVAAAEYIAGLTPDTVDYARIPTCTYCRPEVASIGLTLEEAERRGISANTGVFPFYANGKALSLGEGEGFVKIVSDKRFGAVLGVHMVGPHVTEMIGGISLGMRMECTVDELAGTIFPHPSASEAIMEAAHVLTGREIHI